MRSRATGEEIGLVLSNSTYSGVLFVLSPAVVGLFVAFAARQHGGRALGAVVVAVSAALGVIGYAAWNALPQFKEALLITYVLLAVVPTAVAALVTRAPTVRPDRVVAIWAASVASFHVAVVPTIIVSM